MFTAESYNNNKIPAGLSALEYRILNFTGLHFISPCAFTCLPFRQRRKRFKTAWPVVHSIRVNPSNLRHPCSKYFSSTNLLHQQLPSLVQGCAELIRGFSAGSGKERLAASAAFNLCSGFTDDLIGIYIFFLY